MSPIEEFSYLKHNSISYDSVSLIRLYQPIIGNDATLIYQYLVQFFDDGRKKHKFSEILNHIQFDMRRFEDALVMLTAIDLIKLYRWSGAYLIKMQPAMTNEAFLANPIYRSLLERRIGEVAVAELALTVPENARDLSKKLTDVFPDLENNTASPVTAKTDFDLESFRHRMVRDGLRFNNEKDDVLALFAVADRFNLNWFETYDLAKQTAIGSTISPKRMRVQKEEAGQSTEALASADFSQQETVIIREANKSTALLFLEKIKQARKAVVTKSERDLLEELANMGFLDPVINVMVLYTFNKTKSANLNKPYLMKIANDFSYQNVTRAEDAVLKMRSFNERKQAQKVAQAPKSNVPEWSNPDYKEETSPEKQANLEKFRSDALKRLERLGKDGD